MKYLIIGLGNPGAEYAATRHNIGFEVLDCLATRKEVAFEPARYGDKTLITQRGRQFYLVKPTTYMNLSGKAVRYWLNELKIAPKNLLVIVDDIALPLGTIRIRGKGSDGGHNGLASIQELVGHTNYPRLRFGIGNDFPTGGQVSYVLGQWNEAERKALPPAIDKAADAALDFGFLPFGQLMSQYNS